MEGQEGLFDLNPYTRQEAMGEQPPLTREQYLAMADDLHDLGRFEEASKLVGLFVIEEALDKIL